MVPTGTRPEDAFALAAPVKLFLSLDIGVGSDYVLNSGTNKAYAYAENFEILESTHLMLYTRMVY